MAKVEPVKELQIKTVYMLKDMKIGDIAEVIDTTHRGMYLYRCYGNRVISLSNGEYTWDNLTTCPLEVRILDKGEQIILTQER